MSPRAKKLRVGILFGGQSAEHEVSVVSAQGVLAAIDSDRFKPVPMGITRQGTWLTPAQTTGHRRSAASGVSTWYSR
jgi:D-alanine-D-alanine ligase